ILAHRPELGRTDVERLAGRRGHGRRAHDRVDEILDGKQLVAVVPLAEDVDPSSLSDPVEQDLEDTEALRSDEGLRPNDRRLAGCDATETLGVDLRLAVPTDADEWVVLLDRMLLGNPVDRR